MAKRVTTQPVVRQPTPHRLPGIACLALAGTLAVRGVWAFDDGSLENGPPLETPNHAEQIEGIVLDHTMTQIGREFYQAFSTTWRGLGDVTSINLALYERPSARWGSLIWIEHKSGRVYQAFLYPGRQRAREAGEQSALQVFRRVGQLEVERELFKDPDLGGEEI